MSQRLRPPTPSRPISARLARSKRVLPVRRVRAKQPQSDRHDDPSREDRRETDGQRKTDRRRKTDGRPKTNGRPKSDERRRRHQLEGLWRAFRRTRAVPERNALVEAYQQLVRDLARRFASRLPRSVDAGDLATAANVGLMAAIESFDPTRRVPFESYCELRVKGALVDELRAQDWLPRPYRARVEQHKRALERLRSTLGRDPSHDELAHALDVTLSEYRRNFAAALPGAPAGSMPVSAHSDEALHSLDVVPDRSLEHPGDKLGRDELLRLVTQKLSAQESRIVYLKYWEELPMREIGELEGLSESRVCKIHMRLLARLQERFRAHVAQGA